MSTHPPGPQDPLTPVEHERLRTDLGPYVLGGLPAEEVAALEQHLAGCAACRAELEQLEPAASALAELRFGPLPADGVPPPDLGARVVRLVAADRDDLAGRRAERVAGRRRTAVAAVAGLAAGVAILAAGLTATGAFDAEQTDDVVPLEAVPVSTQAPGLAADADLIAHTWGVEVKLTATGFDQGDRFRVALVNHAGERYPAGEFVGTGTREMVCNLNSALLRDDASGFVVRDSEGTVVLRSQFA